MNSQEIGVLVIGHGTRDRTGQAQMRNLACQTAGLLATWRTDLGFLELAEPSITDGVRSLAAQGVKKLISVPVLLFRAGHADRDIPEAVQAAAQDCGVEVLAQTSPLEYQPTVLALSAERFHAAIERSLGPGQVQSQDISLLMIARGSSSDTAAAAMTKMAQLRTEMTPVADHRVGYVAVRQPNVEQSLDWLASTPNNVLVVQPHLLFEGEVYHSLCSAVAERQQIDSRRWIVCDPLGAAADNFDDSRLAGVLAQLVRDELAKYAASASAAQQQN